MKLSEFKKQLKQLEDKLLIEYNLSDEEVELSIKIIDDHGITFATVNELYQHDRYNEAVVILGYT